MGIVPTRLLVQKASDFSRGCRKIRQGAKRRPQHPARPREAFAEAAGLLGARQDCLLSRFDTEIALEFAPTTVNVIGRIAGGVRLDIEELDEKRRPLDVIGIGFTGLSAA